MKVEEERVIEIDKRAEFVAFPSMVKYIDACACERGIIASLELEKTEIIQVGNQSFAYCSLLQKVRFPPSLEEISNAAFFGCNCLRHIILPIDSTLRKIGLEAFKYCKSLERFNFPSSLEIIDEYAFEECPKLKKYDLRKTKIQIIGFGAFDNDVETIVMLPPTISISNIVNASQNQVIIDEMHPFIKSDGSGSYYAAKSIIIGNKNLMHFQLRRGIEIIGANCFLYSKITSVIITASVTTICFQAFSDSQNLRSVSFSEFSSERNQKVGIQQLYIS